MRVGKMSEKRFEFYSDEDLVGVLDIVTGRTFNSFEIVDVLNEQQAIIQSLKEENEQLREINKELGDDLYNCRLNKNIIREKLKLWQDAHKEYNIYSIKDFEESFELDAKINKEKGI